jgi:hypothetical protein
MTKEQIKIEIQKQTSFDKLYSFWKDPRQRFNNAEINKKKKNNYLHCLLVILATIIALFLIKAMSLAFIYLK